MMIQKENIRQSLAEEKKAREEQKEGETPHGIAASVEEYDFENEQRVS